ncbi:MAG TPA: alpha/beta hydrolase [Tepidisphaeraceae bacterium]|jgi:hypothetical protein
MKIVSLYNFFSLMIVLGGVALALYGMAVFILARMLTRPPRLTDARALARVGRMTPADLSLPFENGDFVVRDEKTGRPLTLSTWWIPHPTSGRTAILIHGYADGKAGSIAWAPLLIQLGFNVLAVDLRAHGHSEGTDTTAGYFERYDIGQIIDQLKAQRPAQTRSIILFGISMGAAVAAAVASQRDDISAIILDSPYATFRDAARCHANLTGLPGESFLALGWKLSKWRTGAKLEEVDPQATIPKSRCPVLIIASTRDLLVSPDSQKCLQSVTELRGDCSRVWARDAAHVLSYPTDPAEYARQIEQFLVQAISGRGV